MCRSRLYSANPLFLRVRMALRNWRIDRIYNHWDRLQELSLASRRREFDNVNGMRWAIYKPIAGLPATLIGPYASEEDAEDWALKHLEPYSTPWSVIPMDHPTWWEQALGFGLDQLRNPTPEPAYGNAFSDYLDAQEGDSFITQDEEEYYEGEDDDFAISYSADPDFEDLLVGEDLRDIFDDEPEAPGVHADNPEPSTPQYEEYDVRNIPVDSDRLAFYQQGDMP